MREMDAYDVPTMFESNSVLPAENSLFPEFFSLIIGVGKCLKSGCITGRLGLRNRLCKLKLQFSL